MALLGNAQKSASVQQGPSCANLVRHALYTTYHISYIVYEADMALETLQSFPCQSVATSVTLGSTRTLLASALTLKPSGSARFRPSNPGATMCATSVLCTVTGTGRQLPCNVHMGLLLLQPLLGVQITPGLILTPLLEPPPSSAFLFPYSPDSNTPFPEPPLQGTMLPLQVSLLLYRIH